MKNPFVRLAFAGLGLLLVSCESPVVERRVESHSQAFRGLSNPEKRLVLRGEVGKGMSKQGVWLAWGEPDKKTTSMVRGKPYEKWTYTGYVPTYGLESTYDLGDGHLRKGYTGPFMASQSAGDDVLSDVRHGYFYGDHLAAWNMIWGAGL